MKIPLVNEQDEIIGYKERGTLLPEDINRASGLWIENTKGEVMLLKRSSKVFFAPNIWSSLTGTVDEGETYETNIIKEAKEELGFLLDISKLEKYEKVLYTRKDNPYKNRYFVVWYKLVEDVDLNSFSLDPNEVSEVKWFTKQELLDLYKTCPEMFFTHFDQNLKMFGIL